jgi:hypothetical protein
LVKQREILDNIAYELAFSHILSVPGGLENLLHTQLFSLLNFSLLFKLLT